MKIGYVVKRYPRYSETFIVNELLAHEASGMETCIFALRPPSDTHFQDAIARVRAPVRYLRHAGTKARELWDAMAALRTHPDSLMAGLEANWDVEVVDLYQALQLAQHVRTLELDHLHAHFASSPTTVARLAAKMADISYSFTAHAKDIFHEDVDSSDLCEKLRDASAVVTVSDFNTRHLTSIEPTVQGRLRRIYNGMDLETFRFESPVSRPPLILAVGRLVEKKGFADLLEACALLRADGRRMSCRIIGAGLLEDALRERIEQLQLGEFVELVGPLPQAQIRQEVQSAAVFAAPCVISENGDRDGLPTTLVEAMALGTPIISTDVTGIPEILEDGVTGLMVPQHDPRRLAVALGRLLDDAELRQKLAGRARQLIEGRFDIRRNTAELRELFRADKPVRKLASA